MRLNYPWLQDPYYESENEKFSKREFLKSIDNFLNQRQYVKITLLDWNSEAPLKSIEGDIISGSLTKEGSGAVRRAGNINCAFSIEEYNGLVLIKREYKNSLIRVFLNNSNEDRKVKMKKVIDRNIIDLINNEKVIEEDSSFSLIVEKMGCRILLEY